MTDLSIICIDAGKSYITYYMLKSLLALDINANIFILCNTDNEYISLLDEFKFKTNINIIYDFECINETMPIYERHIVSFIKLLSYVNTDYVFLCDNDVLFTNNFKSYIEYYKKFDLIVQEEDIDNKIKYFVKDIFMFDNNIHIFDENASNIYLNNEYYNGLKLISNTNNLYKYKTINNIEIEWFKRFLPYHIFFNKSKLLSLQLFDKNFEIGYSVDKKKCYDSFSTITYNALKNNFNIFKTNFNNSVIHVRSSTWYRNKLDYINRLKEISVNFSDLSYLLNNV